MNGRENPGNNMDPVANSIRNEQMGDAVPGVAEREELAREAKECDECGELKDSTQPVNPEYEDECSAHQHPDGRLPHLCVDCLDAKRETKQDVVQQHFAEGDDYVVEYGCGVLIPVDRQLALMADFGSDAEYPEERGWCPSVGIEHRCGETIETVWTPGDFDG